MPTILSIMESSGLDRKEWPCEWSAFFRCWLLCDVTLTDDEAEALFAHALRKAIRARGRLRIEIDLDGFTEVRLSLSDGQAEHDAAPTELDALAALLRAVKGT